MATTKLSFAAQAGLNWQSGDPTPAHSYSTFQLLEGRPHNEQVKIFYPCDTDQSTPLTAVFDEVSKTFRVAEIQAAAPCNGNYNPKTMDIEAYRKTPREYSYVTFTDGAKLTAASLNLETDQLLHLIQETWERLNETNPYWNVLPNFTCALTASIQCDVTNLLSRMTQEETNVDNLQTWVGGDTTNDATIPHKWSYTTSEGLRLVDNTISGANYSISSLFDHSRALHHYVRGLRDDVNFLLCQQGPLDGATITGATSTFPVDAQGNTWDPFNDTGCKHVKLTFTMSNNKTFDAIYTIGPYIKTIEETDTGPLGNSVEVTFTFCDGTTQSISYAKRAGPEGPEGPKGDSIKGDGFFVWKKGPLENLMAGDSPDLSLYGDGTSNLCYAVTQDSIAITNPQKGVAGGVFQELSDSFGGPGSTSGNGDYTGYLLRWEDRGQGEGRKWYSTDMQFPVGANNSATPLKYYWDTVDLDTGYPPINSGRMLFNDPTDLTQVTEIAIPYVDATGNNVNSFVEHLVSGQQQDPLIGIGTLVISSERAPGNFASYKIVKKKESYVTNGGGVVVTVEHLNSSDSNPFNVWVTGTTTERERLTLQIDKHGQTAAIPAMWSLNAFNGLSVNSFTTWFDSLIKIPDSWKKLVCKSLTVTFANEIAGSADSNPVFKGRLMRASQQAVRSYAYDAVGTSWHTNATTLASVQSVTNNANLAQFAFQAVEDDIASEITLPGVDNGYLFFRVLTGPGAGFNKAVLNVEVEGKYY